MLTCEVAYRFHIYPDGFFKQIVVEIEAPTDGPMNDMVDFDMREFDIFLDNES